MSNRNDLVCFANKKQDSYIWNLVRKGRRLIQENFFQEVRNEEWERFQEDALLQFPYLDATIDSPILYQNCRDRQLIKVRDLQEQGEDSMGFQRWFPWSLWEKLGNGDEIGTIMEALQDHYILVNNRQDKLSWGRSPKGNLSVQEAYNIEGGYTNDTCD